MSTRTKKVLAALCASAALLAGCGGGDDAPQAVTVAASTGVWAGSTSTGRDMTALFLGDGRYYLVYSGVGRPAAIGGLVQGTVAAAGPTLVSSDGVDFNLEGAGAASGTLEATLSLVPLESFSSPGLLLGGTLRPGTGTSAAFSATLAADSARPATLAALAGSYPGEVAFSLGTRPATFTVTAAGEVASVINACTITGAAAPRTDLNGYDLAITFGGTPCVFPNLRFTGVAHYQAANGRLVAAVRNPAIGQAIVFAGTRS